MGRDTLGPPPYSVVSWEDPFEWKIYWTKKEYFRALRKRLDKDSKVWYNSI